MHLNVQIRLSQQRQALSMTDTLHLSLPPHSLTTRGLKLSNYSYLWHDARRYSNIFLRDTILGSSLLPKLLTLPKNKTQILQKRKWYKIKHKALKN